MKPLMTPQLRFGAALPEVSDGPVWDGVLAAVGFETRARAVAEAFADRVQPAAARLAIPFPLTHGGAFGDNARWFRDNGYVIGEPADEDFASQVGAFVSEVCEANEAPHICVDISSMNRLRLAQTVECLALHATGGTKVDFAYIPASYYTPANAETVIEYAGPATSAFAGWSASPGIPSVAVVGVGFEYEQALGVVQYLDPAEVWALEPRGGDARFADDVEAWNRDFISAVAPSNRWAYDLSRPDETQTLVEGLVASMVPRARPVLVPFGPKLLALCMLLCAQRFSPNVAVWRVSAGTRTAVYDAQPDHTRAVFHRVEYHAPPSGATS